MTTRNPQSGVEPDWGFLISAHGIGLFLCLEFLHDLLFDICPLSEGLKLCHLPLHNTLGRKRANQFMYLVF